MNDSFWTGGPKAYAKGLSDRYDPQIAELEKRLDSIDESKRVELERQLAELRAEYAEKQKAIDDALF